MKKGALVNILLGAIVALLPLYNRVALYDVNRTVKDNLLVVLLGFICLIMPNPVRRVDLRLWPFILFGVLFLIINQHNVMSILVSFQVFYITASLFFFIHFYEKHDRQTLNYILNGMAIGCLAQSLLGIFGYFGINIYPELFNLFADNFKVVNADPGPGNVIGSLGNNNLLGSYIALTSLSFLSHKNKWPILIPATALFLSGSLMGIASFLGGIFFYINLNYKILKKWQMYSVASLGMIIFPFLSLGIDSGRLDIWKKNIDLVDFKHFLIGRGAGWFGDQKIFSIDNIATQEHNSFLSFFNIFGIIGIVLIFPVLKRYLMAKENNKVFPSILFASFCNSYGHFTLHQSTVAIIITITAAVCMAEGSLYGRNLEWR